PPAFSGPRTGRADGRIAEPTGAESGSTGILARVEGSLEEEGRDLDLVLAIAAVVDARSHVTNERGGPKPQAAPQHRDDERRCQDPHGDLKDRGALNPPVPGPGLCEETKEEAVCYPRRRPEEEGEVKPLHER